MLNASSPFFILPSLSLPCPVHVPRYKRHKTREKRMPLLTALTVRWSVDEEATIDGTTSRRLAFYRQYCMSSKKERDTIASSVGSTSRLPLRYCCVGFLWRSICKAWEVSIEVCLEKLLEKIDFPANSSARPATIKWRFLWPREKERRKLDSE